MAEQSDLVPAERDLASGRAFSSIGDVQQWPDWPGWLLTTGTIGAAGGGIALAPSLVLAGAAAETAGAAAITSGLASFGAGTTMMSGVANLGLLGGALGTAVVWSLVHKEQAKVKWSVVGSAAVGAAVGTGVSVGMVIACAAAGTGGAAVVTSGLAALGGGAVAAGGLGMVGGIVACTGIGAGLAILFGLAAYGIWWYLGETSRSDDDPTEDTFFTAVCDEMHLALSTDDVSQTGAPEPHDKFILKPHAQQPTFKDFGIRPGLCTCAACNSWIFNRGCSVCERRLCHECFSANHVRSCSAELSIRSHLDFIVAQAQVDRTDDEHSAEGHVADRDLPGFAERRSILRSGTITIIAEVARQLENVDANQPWFKFWSRRGPCFIKRILRLLALQLLLAAVIDPDGYSADNLALAQAFNRACKHLTTKGSEQFGVPYARLLCEALGSFSTKLKQGTESWIIQYQLAFFGLQSDARPEDIILAHRRLIRRMHPDKAKTDEMRQFADSLSGYINVARDRLMARSAIYAEQNPLELTDGTESNPAELQVAEAVHSQQGDDAKLTPWQWLCRLRSKYVRLHRAIRDDHDYVAKHIAMDRLRLRFDEELQRAEEEVTTAPAAPAVASEDMSAVADNIAAPAAPAAAAEVRFTTVDDATAVSAAPAEAGEDMSTAVELMISAPVAQPLATLEAELRRLLPKGPPLRKASASSDDMSTAVQEVANAPAVPAMASDDILAVQDAIVAPAVLKPASEDISTADKEVLAASQAPAVASDDMSTAVEGVAAAPAAPATAGEDISTAVAEGTDAPSAPSAVCEDMSAVEEVAVAPAAASAASMDIWAGVQGWTTAPKAPAAASEDMSTAEGVSASTSPAALAAAIEDMSTAVQEETAAPEAPAAVTGITYKLGVSAAVEEETAAPAAPAAVCEDKPTAVQDVVIMHGRGGTAGAAPTRGRLELRRVVQRCVWASEDMSTALQEALAAPAAAAAASTDMPASVREVIAAPSAPAAACQDMSTAVQETALDPLAPAAANEAVSTTIEEGAAAPTASASSTEDVQDNITSAHGHPDSGHVDGTALGRKEKQKLRSKARKKSQRLYREAASGPPDLNLPTPGNFDEGNDDTGSVAITAHIYDEVASRERPAPTLELDRHL